MPIPSKWVDTIKNIHEKHKPDYVPEFQSAGIVCQYCVRTDAPASDVATRALPIDRIVIMRQPQGLLPGVDPDAFCSSEYLFMDSAIAVEVFGRESTTTLRRSDC